MEGNAKEPTLEQKRAIAVASARLRLKEPPAYAAPVTTAAPGKPPAPLATSQQPSALEDGSGASMPSVAGQTQKPAGVDRGVLFRNYWDAEGRARSLSDQFRAAQENDDALGGLPGARRKQELEIGRLASLQTTYAKATRGAKGLFDREMDAVVKEASAIPMTMDRDGLQYADPSKVTAVAKGIARQHGIEDPEFEKLVYDRLLAHVDTDIVAKDANRRFEEKAKPFMDAEQLRMQDAFKTDSIEYAKAKSFLEASVASVNAASKADVDMVSTRTKQEAQGINAALDQAGKQYEAQTRQIQQAAASGALPPDQAQQQLDEAYKGYQQQFADGEAAIGSLNATAIREVSAINARYNRRFQEEQRRVLEGATQRIDAAAAKFAKEYGSTPEGMAARDKLKELQVSAWGEASEARGKKIEAVSDARFAKQKLMGGVMGAMGARFGESVVEGLGGSFKGIASTAGNDDLYLLGEEMSRAFVLPETKSDSFSDLLDARNLAQSSGQLVGGMLPSVAASTAAAVATGGASIPVQMLASGAAGWGAETLDIAGRAQDDVYRATGSREKAGKAGWDSFVGQVQLMPAYAFEGLPFVGKALDFVPTKALRMGAAAGVEYGTELLQEIPQNIADANIRQGKKPYEDFWQGLEDMSDSGELKSLLVTMAPISILGAGGQITSKGRKKAIEDGVKSYIAKNEVAKYAEGASGQWLNSMIEKGGDNFATAVIQGMYSGAQIDQAKVEELLRAKERVLAARDEASRLRLRPNDASAYVGISATRDALLERAKSMPDGIEKTIATKRASEIERSLSDFAISGKRDYVAITYADGTTTLLDRSGAMRMLNSPAFVNEVARQGGDISIDFQGEATQDLVGDFQAAVMSAQDEMKESSPDKPTVTVDGISPEDAAKVEEYNRLREQYDKAKLKSEITGEPMPEGMKKPAEVKIEPKIQEDVARSPEAADGITEVQQPAAESGGPAIANDAQAQGSGAGIPAPNDTPSISPTTPPSPEGGLGGPGEAEDSSRGGEALGVSGPVAEEIVEPYGEAPAVEVTLSEGGSPAVATLVKGLVSQGVNTKTKAREFLIQRQREDLLGDVLTEFDRISEEQKQKLVEPKPAPEPKKKEQAEEAEAQEKETGPATLSTVQARRLKMDSELSDTERDAIINNPVHGEGGYRASIDAAKGAMVASYTKHGNKPPIQMADAVMADINKIANPVSRAYAMGDLHRTLHDLAGASDIPGQERVAIQAKSAEVVNKMAALALQAGRTGAVFAEVYNDFGMFASQVRGRILEKAHDTGLDNPENEDGGKSLRENIEAARKEIDDHLESAPELKELLSTLENINQALREALVQKILAGKATPLDPIGELSVEDILDGTPAIDRKIADLEASLRRSQEQLALASDKRSEKSREQRKSLADKIRSLKIDTKGVAGAFIIPPGVINSAIEAMALAVEGGAAIADAIRDGVAKMHGSAWYKSLGSEDKKSAERTLHDHIRPVAATKKARPPLSIEQIEKRIERQKAALEKLKAVRKSNAEKATLRKQNKELRAKVESLDLVKMANARKNGKYTTPKKMLDKAMKAIRQGALWSSDLSSAFAEAFGVTQFTAKDRDMIQHFTYALDYFEDSGQREMAQRYSKKFNEYLDNATKDRSTAQKVSEFLLDALYQNALATYSTLMNATGGSTLTGIWNGTAATTRTLLSKHGGLGAQMYGFRRFIQEQPAAVSKALGRTSAYDAMGTYHDNVREGRPSPYDTHLINGFMRHWDKLKNDPKASEKVKAAGMVLASALSQATRFGHIMRFIDAYLTHSLANYKQAMDEYAAEAKKLDLPTTPILSWHKRINSDLFKKIDNAVGYGVDARAAAEVQADEDVSSMEASGIKVPAFYRQRRISEILETSVARDAEMWKANLELSREMLMMGSPDGLPGMASSALTKSMTIRKNDGAVQVVLKTLAAMNLMFLRITGSNINHLQQGVPILGTLGSMYGIRKGENGAWRFGFKGDTKAAREKMNHRVAASLLSAALMVGLLADMFDWDDDEEGNLKPVPDPDRLFDATANAYGNYKMNEGIEEGRQNFSIRTRGSKDDGFSDWLPTRLVPGVAMPAAIMGRLMDDAKGHYLDVPGKKSKPSSLKDLAITAPLNVIGEASFNSIGRAVKKWRYAQDTEQTEGIMYDMMLQPVTTIAQPGIYREAINTAAMFAGDPRREKRRTTSAGDAATNALASVYGLDMLLLDEMRDDFGIPIERVDPVRSWLHGLNDADKRSKDHPEVALRHMYSGVMMPPIRNKPNYIVDSSIDASKYEKTKKRVYLTEEQKDGVDLLSRSIFRVTVLEKMEKLKAVAKTKEANDGFGAEYLSEKMSSMRSAANSAAEDMALDAINGRDWPSIQKEIVRLQKKADQMAK
jgi:hypothetical protein